MHVPPRHGAGPPAADPRGPAAPDVPQLPAPAASSRREHRARGPAQDARARRQGHALLHQGLRPEPRG